MAISIDNTFGIHLLNSNNHFVSGNELINNGLVIFNTYFNEIGNNLVNGNPLIYLEDETDITVDEPTGQVLINTCENIIVRN